jgi:hypothetical protein
MLKNISFWQHVHGLDSSRLDTTRRTERSIAKSGSQPVGGMILHIPYLLALSYMLLIYSIGSRNSSSVGVNVGASTSPCGLFLGGGSRVKGFLRSTVFISKGAARRALYGIVGGAELGIAPFARPIGTDFVVAALWVGFPPVEGGATIVGKGKRIDQDGIKLEKACSDARCRLLL